MDEKSLDDAVRSISEAATAAGADGESVAASVLRAVALMERLNEWGVLDRYMEAHLAEGGEVTLESFSARWRMATDFVCTWNDAVEDAKRVHHYVMQAPLSAWSGKEPLRGELRAGLGGLASLSHNFAIAAGKLCEFVRYLIQEQARLEKREAARGVDGDADVLGKTLEEIRNAFKNGGGTDGRTN